MDFRILILILVPALVSSLSVEDCPSHLERDTYLHYFDGACYRFEMNEKKTFQDAQNICHGNGGNLAIVKTESLNTYLFRQIPQYYNPSNYYRPSLWIGLRYERENDAYYWVDGSRMAYSNFSQNARYDDGFDCVTLWPGSYRWQPMRCDNHLFRFSDNAFPFICQHNIVNKPTPKPTVQPIYESITVEDCPSNLRRNDKLRVHGNMCYLFMSHESETYANSQAYCQRKGGDLAMVKSKSTNDFIMKELQKKVQKFSNRYYGNAWIGLRYSSTRSMLTWVDGTRPDFVNFKLGFAKFRDECIAMRVSDGLWGAEHCGDYFNTRERSSEHFVCEFHPISGKYYTETTSGAQASTTTAATVTAQPTLATNQPSVLGTEYCPVTDGNEKNTHILNHICYYLSLQQSLTFHKAEEFCSMYGGSLALVKSKVVNDFLYKTLKRTHHIHYYEDPFWIGLQYNVTSGTYYWSDGTNMEYSNFRLNGQYGECAAMSPLDGKWTHMECHDNSSAGFEAAQEQRHFICEFATKTGAHTTGPSGKTPANSNSTPSTTTAAPQTATTTEPLMTTETATTTRVQPTTTTPATKATTMPPTNTTIPPANATMPSTITTMPPTITTMPPTITTMPPTTTTVPPATTTMPPTTTTMPPTTTAIQTSTAVPTTTAPRQTTCPTIVCELDCGLDGYKQDDQTGCMICECDN